MFFRLHPDLYLSDSEELKEKQLRYSAGNCDTWVYPLVQMGPLFVMNDETVTLELLRNASREDEILLASGYFNLTDHYMEVILQESLAKYRLLMAAPEV